VLTQTTKGSLMAVNLKKPQWLIDAQKAGVPITHCATGASSGITAKQWGRKIRGESEPVELPRTERVPGTLKLRLGHGAVR
jgi:hypothetical protein